MLILFNAQDKAMNLIAVQPEQIYMLGPDMRASTVCSYQSAKPVGTKGYWGNWIIEFRLKT